MKKQEAEIKKVEALKLYLSGMSKEEVAKTVKVSDKTVWEWSKKNNWDALYGDTKNKIIEAVQSDIISEKVRSLKLIRAIESIYAKQLNEGVTIKTSEFAQVQKVKWEILMPRTISQYNFMKQENNLGPTYTLEIVNPNDNKNEMVSEPEAIRSTADTER